MAKLLCAKQCLAGAEKFYMCILAVLTDFAKSEDFATLAASMFLGFTGLNEFANICCMTSSNLSFVRYKLGNFKGAAERATYAPTAADTPPKDKVKALYRRGLAHYALKEYIIAASDFFYAQSLCPGDRMVERELEKVNDRLGEMYPRSAYPMEMAKMKIERAKQQGRAKQASKQEM